MSTFLAAAAVAVPELIALVGGRVHTMTPGAQPAERAVVIDAGVIKALCGPLEVPANARRIDVSGLHVVPAFIDALAYHDPEHDRLYTLSGVGRICDHGNDLARILDAREPVTRAAAWGPEITTAGVLIDGKPPATNIALVLESLGDAHEAIEHLGELKVSFLATHAQLAPDVWRALVKEGTEKSLWVMGPRPKGMDLAAVLEARPRALVALDALLPEGKTWSNIGLEELPVIAKAVAESGVWVIPTLSALSKDLEALDPKSPDLALLGPNYVSYWSNELEQRLAQNSTEARERRELIHAKARALLTALYAAGAKLAPGSGAPHPWLLPGEGLHRELAQWAAAGVSAYDCLAACTRGAAECFGLADSGTIEVGKQADLALLRADPLASVAALREVAGLVRRGTYVDAVRLSELRDELRAWVKQTREQFDRPIEVEAPALPEGAVLLSGSCETISPAGRLAAERFAVVREVDDTLTFCGRRLTRGSVATPQVQIDVRQRVRKSRLDSFEVRASAQGRVLVVRGLKVGEQWRVERRLDDKFVDLNAAREELAAIDCDSITTPMLLALTRKPGAFPVMRFHEGLELEVVRWDLAINPEGDHGFKTPTGLKLCAFDPSGVVKVLVEQLGASESQTTLLDFDTHGGAGLGLPEETLAKLRAAAAAQAGEKR